MRWKCFSFPRHKMLFLMNLRYSQRLWKTSNLLFFKFIQTLNFCHQATIENKKSQDFLRIKLETFLWCKKDNLFAKKWQKIWNLNIVRRSQPKKNDDDAQNTTRNCVYSLKNRLNVLTDVVKLSKKKKKQKFVVKI